MYSILWRKIILVQKGIFDVNAVDIFGGVQNVRLKHEGIRFLATKWQKLVKYCNES